MSLEEVQLAQIREEEDYPLGWNDRFQRWLA